MIEMSERLAKKTGLSKYDCDAILKTLAFEIIEDLKTNKSVHIHGLGSLISHKSTSPYLIYLKLEESVKKRLVEECKKIGDEEHAIIFD